MGQSLKFDLIYADRRLIIIIATIMKLCYLLPLLGIFHFDYARAFKCHEGFNATIVGLPLYHWTERVCNDNSNCFSQEIKTQIPRSNLEVSVRYGGCISRAYSKLISCGKLFGEESDLDPAVLFKMLPGLDDKFKAMSADFEDNITESFRKLFSDGTGTKSFIEGCYTFLTNIGFNMKKALPLKSHFVELMNMSLPRPQKRSTDEYSRPPGVPEEEPRKYEARPQKRIIGDYPRPIALPAAKPRKHEVDRVIEDFMNALGNLDTKEPAISTQIYSFMANFIPPPAIKHIHDSVYSPFVNNLPGLIKSILPESWQVDKWFDVFFELLGDVNLHDPRRSTVDFIDTMKKNVKIPQEYSEYLDPIMNRAPDLVENIATGNYNYASHWSVKLLTDESTVSSVTKRLSTAFHKLYISVFGKQPTGDVDLLITWAPGLYYKLFPGEKNEIDKIYNTIAEGIEAMDFNRPNITMKKTKMSDFITFMLDRTLYRSPEFSTVYSTRFNLIVINLSRVAYTLLHDYEGKLDIIFTALLEGFRTWPDIDLGEITERVITDLGYKIPRPLKPLLDHLQSLIMPTISDSDASGEDALLDTVQEVTKAYKMEYPNSEFPDIVWRVAQYLNKSFRGRPRDLCDELYEIPDVNYTVISECFKKQLEIDRKFDLKMYDMAVDIHVDLQFAVFNQIDSGDRTIYEKILTAFPDFKFYIRLMRVLDRQDVKQIYKDYMKWILFIAENQMKRGFFSSMVWAFNETVSKITSKFGDFTNELRGRFSPKSCKFDTCTSQLCNTQTRMTSVKDSTLVKHTKMEQGVFEKIESNKTSKVDSTKTNRAKHIVNAGKVKHDPTVKPTTTTSSSAQISSNHMPTYIALAILVLGKFI